MSLRIALVGNPNAGKTTLFNALTGSHQTVGNWPGVTVEKKEGQLLANPAGVVTDLPGVYSLSPYTPEELITRRYLLEEKPDVILNIVDGTNLERNLYLTTQLLELGIPLLLAVNMMDSVERHGDKIDLAALERRLGCRATPMAALRGEGLQEALALAQELAQSGKAPPTRSCFHGALEHALAHIEERLLHDEPEERQRFLSIKLFERDAQVIAELGLRPADLAHIEYDIALCEAEQEDDAEAIIIAARYDYIEEIVRESCKRARRVGLTRSQRIDRLATHRYLALPLFAALMFFVYFVSVSVVGTASAGLVEDLLVPLSAEGLASLALWPWLEGLLVDGVLGGLGAVLGFLPQILTLFFFLSILESCGYMARIAFILDRLFRRFGLSGKSFIPLLIGTGCSVPGIMAGRTIESLAERRVTIMTTSFIPCGPKLLMISLIASAFFGGAWWLAPTAYFMGIASVLLTGLILKHTRLFRTQESPFVMELPLYQLPGIKSVLRSTWERGAAFVQKAASVILIASVAIWFGSRFGFVDGTFGFLNEGQLSQSLLASLGGLIAWIFVPLGFGTWQAATASIMGLLAKESIVSTMGVLYGFSLGGYGALQAALSPGAAFAFMAFNLLCAPCFAAIAAMRQELQNGKLFAFALLYQTGFAYVVALLIYQVSRLF